MAVDLSDQAVPKRGVRTPRHPSIHPSKFENFSERPGMATDDGPTKPKVTGPAAHHHGHARTSHSLLENRCGSCPPWVQIPLPPLVRGSLGVSDLSPGGEGPRPAPHIQRRFPLQAGSDQPACAVFSHSKRVGDDGQGRVDSTNGNEEAG